jgi:NADH dehydrogenase [ubiquinone] 1 alpha subcomplex assembly factor 7
VADPARQSRRGKACVNVLKQRLAALIAETGPITVAQYMAAALYDPNGGYYTTRALLDDAAGVFGDFITAPIVSQMFGELIGAWGVHEWRTIGAPAPCAWIELGPGTGALSSDAWRVIRTQADAAGAFDMTLVEINATLKHAQTAALAAVGAAARSVDHLDAIAPGPSLIIANEFFDCLPIRQFVRQTDGWRERLIGLQGGALCFGLAQSPLPHDAAIPAALRSAPVGAIAEIASGMAALVDTIARRLIVAPGRCLIIDYGAAMPSPSDTLQAIAHHQKVDPLADPGGADLTAHVDFAALADHAHASGLAVHGPISQSEFLCALGIEARAARLCESRPDKASVIARQLSRLIDPREMGSLFKVLCLSTPALSPPAGF